MKRSLGLLLVLLSTVAMHAQDIEAPMITSISVTPSVDVSSGDQSITATVQITDDDSGFEFGNLFLYRADGNFVSSHAMGSTQMTGGDSLDGTYEVTMTIPQYAPGGTWEVRSFVDDSHRDLQHHPGNCGCFFR